MPYGASHTFSVGPAQGDALGWAPRCAQHSPISAEKIASAKQRAWFLKLQLTKTGMRFHCCSS